MGRSIDLDLNVSRREAVIDRLANDGAASAAADGDNDADGDDGAPAAVGAAKPDAGRARGKPGAPLREIELACEGIGDDGLARLAPLVGTSAVTHLYLTANELGDYGAFALATALRVNHSLRELHLSNNNISDEARRAGTSARAPFFYFFCVVFFVCVVFCSASSRTAFFGFAPAVRARQRACWRRR